MLAAVPAVDLAEFVIGEAFASSTLVRSRCYGRWIAKPRGIVRGIQRKACLDQFSEIPWKIEADVGVRGTFGLGDAPAYLQ